MTANVAERTDPAERLVRLLEQRRGQIAAALPRHLTATRMIRLALTAYQRTPELLDCDLGSVVGCVIQASQLGLELDGVLGHAYMVPFYNDKKKRREAQFIVGYKGYVALANRTGKVARFGAHVVHANEPFEYEHGSDAFLRHRPLLTGRGEPVAVYAELAQVGGAYDFEVLTWDEVLAAQKEYGSKRDGSRKRSPWWTHLKEMARKTAIRRLAKRVDLSVEFRGAAALDEAQATGGGQELPAVSYPHPADVQALASPEPGLATGAQLEALAALARELNLEESEVLGSLPTGVERVQDLTGREAELLAAHWRERLAGGGGERPGPDDDRSQAAAGGEE